MLSVANAATTPTQLHTCTFAFLLFRLSDILLIFCIFHSAFIIIVVVVIIIVVIIVVIIIIIIIVVVVVFVSTIIFPYNRCFYLKNTLFSVLNIQVRVCIFDLQFIQRFPFIIFTNKNYFIIKQ